MPRVGCDLEDRERPVPHVGRLGSRAYDSEEEAERDEDDHRAENGDPHSQLPVVLEGAEAVEGLLDGEGPEERENEDQTPGPAHADHAPETALESLEPRWRPGERRS